ncbi:hypothetical protein, partial [Maribacter sp. 4U21]|uniref:hypothetical protein n=1 Tax=Maribacter sp. 4U21 TaxID=1889779 RepID=UPI001C558B6A
HVAHFNPARVVHFNLARVVYYDRFLQLFFCSRSITFRYSLYYFARRYNLGTARYHNFSKAFTLTLLQYF